jgi:multicomponent Na+:H+ antiporter subunit D
LHDDDLAKVDGGTGRQGKEIKKIQPGFWWAMVILLGGLIAANVFYYEAYTLKNTIKPLATIFIGWLAYLFIFKKLTVKLPRAIEKFDHLIGVMSLMLILLFWTMWAQAGGLI